MNEEYQNSDLVNLLQEYSFNDLIIAAFCLLSWRDNGSKDQMVYVDYIVDCR